MINDHLEVPFSHEALCGNATVQINEHGAYITIECRPTVFVERRHVEQLIRIWDEITQTDNPYYSS